MPDPCSHPVSHDQVRSRSGSRSPASSSSCQLRHTRALLSPCCARPRSHASDRRRARIFRPRRYVSLSCVFSDRTLYASTQASTALTTTSLDLSDPSAWKPMDGALLASLTPLPHAPLSTPTLPPSSSLEALNEEKLRALVDAYRGRLGLRSPGVIWDDELAYLLAPALASYESERVAGCTVGESLFADAIRRKVPRCQPETQTQLQTQREPKPEPEQPEPELDLSLNLCADAVC